MVVVASLIKAHPEAEASPKEVHLGAKEAPTEAHRIVVASLVTARMAVEDLRSASLVPPAFMVPREVIEHQAAVVFLGVTGFLAVTDFQVEKAIMDAKEIMVEVGAVLVAMEAGVR